MNLKHRERRPLHAPVAAVLLAAALAAPGLQAEPARVTAVEVQRQPWVDTLSLTGTLTSPRDATLTPRVSGLVETIHADAGRRVAAGDPLVELDRTLDELTLERLRAELEAARGELAEAERLRDETAPLAEKGLVPTTEAESAQANVRIRAADVARLRAEIRRQEERIDRHRVLAPFAGVVSRRHVEVGEWVENGDPVFDLVATETLRMDVQVPQEHFGLIREGTPAIVRPEIRDGDGIEAEVTERVPVSDPTARTFLVRIRVDNADGALAPGMSGRAVFRSETEDRVPVVPRDATLRYPDGSVRVWVLDERDGETVVASRQIKTGRSGDGLIEVREGLEGGERVVLRGNESLSPGERVRVVEGE